jgi:hypothetical protein
LKDSVLLGFKSLQEDRMCENGGEKGLHVVNVGQYFCNRVDGQAKYRRQPIGGVAYKHLA